jgi:phage tail-like protein
MADLDGDPALSACFSVQVDGQDLGTFTACEGLGAEVVLEQREEGGNNEFVHQLPVRIKYPNVKLTRPLNSDSAKVAEWFAKMGGVIKRQVAHIAARTADDRTIVSWSLHGVIPVRWQGPSLNVDTQKVATETLELAHHGFRQEPDAGLQN